MGHHSLCTYYLSHSLAPPPNFNLANLVLVFSHCATKAGEWSLETRLHGMLMSVNIAFNIILQDMKTTKGLMEEMKKVAEFNVSQVIDFELRQAGMYSPIDSSSLNP